MRTMALAAGIALAGFLALVGSTSAAENAPPGKENTVFRSVDLIGKEVRNAKGETLGQVEDYVINVTDGKIVYVALSYGETLGFGGKLFALPPTAIKLSDDWKTFTMNANKDELEKATGFDANKWPTAPDNKWAAGTTPATRKDDVRRDEKPRDDGKEAHLRRFTSLIGLSVKDQDGNTLGSCQGAGVDLTNNKLVYMVLGYGGVAGVGSTFFAIPCNAVEMKSFDLKAPGKSFVINATKADFEGKAGFDYKKWPNKPDDGFSKNARPK